MRTTYSNRHDDATGGYFRDALRKCTSLGIILAILLPGPAMMETAQAASVSGPTWDGAPLGASWNNGDKRYAGQLNDPYAVQPVAYSVQVMDGAPPPPPPPVSDGAASAAPIQASSADQGAPSDDPGAPPPGAEESLRLAIIAALKQNPDIQIALARQDDARFGVHEAWSGYLPRVDATVGGGRERNDPFNRPGSTSNRTMLTRKEAVVTMNQNIWDFGTTINDIKRARAAYRSAQWATRERIEAISYDISEAYLNVLERQKLVDLAHQEIAGNEKILNMVTIQEDLGLTTPADVNRAKARLDNLKSQLLDRESGLEQAREAYRRLTDHLPGKAVDQPPADKALPQNAQQAVEMIDDHNPRMAQAVQDRRSIERQRASQTGAFFPKLGFMAQGNWRDNVQGPTDFANDARAMLTMTYSFNGGRDYATRARLSARLREADYEVDRRRREVAQDIRIDFNGLQAAREKISAIDSEIEAADRVAELYRQQFREGRRTVFDLLDSQQILYEAKARQVTNGTAKRLAEFRVLQQLGGLFDLVSDGEPLPDIVVDAPHAD